MQPNRVFTKLWRTLLAATTVLLLNAAPAFAQSSGTITGRISDDNTKNSLEGATVEIVELQRSTTTSSDGSYIMRGVPVGEYNLRIVYYGLEPHTGTVTIEGGQSVSASYALQPLIVDEEVIVVGTAMQGQARAINQQRAAKGIKTIINQELFGAADDGNIGEVLQRLPGLSVDTDGFSEIPRYVNIRGISTAFNSVQVDGSRLAVSGTGRGADYGDTGRGFALDDLPADAITNVEIIKAPTPDMDGDGLGGIVNLRTKSAFDYGDRRIDFTVANNTNKLRDESHPSASGTFNDIFELNSGNRLGVSVTMAYYETNEGFDNRDLDYNPLRPANPLNAGLATQPISEGGLQPAYDPVSNSFVQGPGIADETFSKIGERPFVKNSTAPKEVLFYHEDTEYNTFVIDRERLGFSASFDLEVSDTFTLYAKPLYNKEDKHWDDHRYHPIMDNDHGDSCAAYDEAAVLGVLNGLTPAQASALTSADFGNQACHLSRRLEADGSLSAYPVKLGGSATARSTIDFVNENQGRATFDVNGNGRGIIEYFDVDSTFDIELMSLSMGGEKHFESSVMNIDFNYSSTEKTQDYASAEIRRRGLAFEYDRSNRFSADDAIYRLIAPAGQPTPDANEIVLDPSREDVLYLGFLQSRRDAVKEDRWQISLDYERDIFGLQQSGFGTGTWKTGVKYTAMDREFGREQFDYSLAEPGEAGFDAQLWNSLIRNNPNGSMESVAMPYFMDSAAAVNAVAGTAVRNDSVSVAEDYTFDESYWAAYWMASIQAGPLEVTGGIRAEFTEFDTARAARDEDTGTFGIISDSNTYHNILPSLHMKYDIKEWLVLRGSLGETFSRPQMLDLLNTSFVRDNDDPVEIEQGNPKLPAMESKNTDVALEFYFDEGFYSVGYFKKDMNGFSFPQTTIIASDPNFGGREVRIITPLATGRAINEGWEFSAYQRFGFLPDPWSGLFLNGSYTLTDSKAQYPNRDEPDMPTRGASKHLFFLQTGYEWNRFSFSVSYRFRSPYVEGLAFVDQQGENTFLEDDVFGEQEIIDMNLSAQITDNFQFFGSVSNLTDESHASRQGYLDSPEDIYFNKRRITLGLKGSF